MADIGEGAFGRSLAKLFKWMNENEEKDREFSLMRQSKAKADRVHREGLAAPYGTPAQIRASRTVSKQLPIILANAERMKNAPPEINESLRAQIEAIWGENAKAAKGYYETLYEVMIDASRGRRKRRSAKSKAAAAETEEVKRYRSLMVDPDLSRQKRREYVERFPGRPGFGE